MIWEIIEKICFTKEFDKKRGEKRKNDKSRSNNRDNKQR